MEALIYTLVSEPLLLATLIGCAFTLMILLVLRSIAKNAIEKADAKDIPAVLNALSTLFRSLAIWSRQQNGYRSAQQAPPVAQPPPVPQDGPATPPEPGEIQ